MIRKSLSGVCFYDPTKKAKDSHKSRAKVTQQDTSDESGEQQKESKVLLNFSSHISAAYRYRSFVHSHRPVRVYALRSPRLPLLCELQLRLSVTSSKGKAITT
jgi:hypothetical protein